MAIVDELIAVLGYKLEGKGNLQQFNQGLDVAEKKSRATAAVLTRLGGALAGAISVTAVKAAVTNFADFERTMTRIGITAGALPEETQKASEAVQKMAKDFAMPVQEATKGLDTLVSSGKDLGEAMDFLPSVLATAQAAGATTTDIANTAVKTSEALKISADDMQRAFDIMVAGGKAGQFELKDMAHYIPELANSFASLGYKGQDGLQKLIALLQTLREDTGSASTAAVQAQNVFGKIYAEQTAKAFKDFGIDLENELKKRIKSGEDTVQAFVNITREALKGDLTKLPKLFTDQEFRLGMQSLVTSADSYKKFIDAVNGSKVDGQVLQDLNRVLSDTEAKIQRMSNSWDRFTKALGEAASGPVGSMLDAASGEIDYGMAIRKGLEKRGMSYWERENWLLWNTFNTGEKDALAREGGFKSQGGHRPEADASLPTPLDRRAVDPDRMDRGTIRDSIKAQLGNMNSHLEAMVGRANLPAQATITDQSQDNRSYPVTVNAPITLNVQQATQAPQAVGQAVQGAIQSGANVQPSRMQAGPAQ